MTQQTYPRTAKPQLMCAECKKKCLPKEGDWFWSENSNNQQYFLCKVCEQKTQLKPDRAVKTNK
jgi:hypothetical protein